MCKRIFGPGARAMLLLRAGALGTVALARRWRPWSQFARTAQCAHVVARYYYLGPRCACTKGCACTTGCARECAHSLYAIWLALSGGSSRLVVVCW